MSTTGSGSGGQRLATTRTFRTLQKLTDAATEVFGAQGFHAAQVGDIAAAASMSRATFYNYFSSKEELLRHMVHAALPDLLATGGPGKQSLSPWQRMRASTEAYLDAYERNATLMRIWNEAAQRSEEMAALLRESREPFLDRTEQSLRRLQGEGFADAGLEPRYAAQALTGMVTAFAFTWFVEGQQFDREIAVDTLVRLWGRAIGLQMEE